LQQENIGAKLVVSVLNFPSIFALFPEQIRDISPRGGVRIASKSLQPKR
jgi:hypothetical protein